MQRVSKRFALEFQIERGNTNAAGCGASPVGTPIPPVVFSGLTYTVIVNFLDSCALSPALLGLIPCAWPAVPSGYGGDGRTSFSRGLLLGHYSEEQLRALSYMYVFALSIVRTSVRKRVDVLLSCNGGHCV